MKTITARELSRETSSVLDAVERGEAFELRRGGKAVAYITSNAPPAPPRKNIWDEHFEWLAKQPKTGFDPVKELEEDRRRQRERERAMEFGR